MNKGGLIIRLIDVAMIILFGFIAISDIKVRAQIKLPSDEPQKEQQKQQKDPVLIFVKIDLDRGFVVERDEEMLFATSDKVELESNLANLVNYNKTVGQETVVLISPDEDSPIQLTVDVLDICERNQIPKNINYESLQF